MHPFCLAGARVDIEWSLFSIETLMCVSLCLVEAVEKCNRGITIVINSNAFVAQWRQHNVRNNDHSCSHGYIPTFIYRMYVHVRTQHLGVPKLYMYGEIVDWILDDNALVQQ